MSFAILISNGSFITITENEESTGKKRLLGRIVQYDFFIFISMPNNKETPGTNLHKPLLFVMGKCIFQLYVSCNTIQNTGEQLIQVPSTQKVSMQFFKGIFFMCILGYGSQIYRKTITELASQLYLEPVYLLLVKVFLVNLKQRLFPKFIKCF